MRIEWREETYAAVQSVLGYSFKDRKLLLTAFTHSSYAGEEGGEDNERLEFLGDAVLELIITDRLVRSRKEDEGKLTELRKQYVSKPALEQAEARLGLMRFLRYAGGENNVGGKTRSNLFEAVVGALYLDGGLAVCADFVRKNLSEIETDNYKTLLQEYVQGRSKDAPHYSTQGEAGEFTSTVSALGKSACGTGESKKEAETAAAKALYRIFTGKKEEA